MSSTRDEAPDDLAAVREALAEEYEVLQELGRGGMAVVYRARERALDRDVALKVLPPARLSDTDLVERFQREARTSARLEHPHIVPIYQVGRRGRVNFFAMKLLRGESLAARLAREGRLPPNEIGRIVRETASALGYAASCGIVHRDVKPDNILLDVDGRCVVTDFGIARSMSTTRITATGMSIGTPRYMSPEQARGQAVDGRSDIYSLGIVAYECLVGQVPFDGEDAIAVLFGHVQSPLPRPPLATAEERALFAIVERMLAKSPEERFQYADEVIAALDPDGANTIAFARGPAPRRADTAPTRQLTVPLDASAAADGVPQPSPALDAAVRAGVDMLRQQRPKVRAHVAAGRQLVHAYAPLVRSAIVRAAGWLLAITMHGSMLLAAGARQAAGFARSRSWRFWIPVAAALVVPVLVYGGVRYVDLHRSRCPSLEASVEGTRGDMAASRQRPLTLLVDAIGARRAGSDLDVYYDVCGLPKETQFETRMAIVTDASILTRLFGRGVQPIVVDYSETANGPATRRHRTISFDRMPPGSYTLDVTITDRSGRRRERGVDFQVLDD